MVLEHVRAGYQILAAAAMLVMLLAGSVKAGQLPTDLTELSLEELMNLEVTSASKKPQKLSEVAAAIFVITPEDIRRSGATSIPEVLRMVPGVQVARVNANTWAVTIRGFNGRFADKLLVLIDGRSIYTPLFSGVYWDMHDTLLEDIERIEVIRGPGAAMWGANAVNGVINIITKHAKDTQGLQVVGGGGNEDRGFGSVRYGGKVGEATYFRIYGKYFNRDSFYGVGGIPANDGWEVGRAGFRLDSKVSDSNSLTFSGDIFKGDSGLNFEIPSLSFPFVVPTNAPIKFTGGHFLGRWQKAFSGSSDLKLQLYYDGTDRRELDFQEIRHTFDVDFQHRFTLGRHELIWGLEYRYSRDRFKNSFTISLNPPKRSLQLFSAFVQDDIALIKDRLHLILGSRFEHNDFTGFEVQPNARLLWTPHAHHSVWAAVSRAVRTPSRLESNGFINATVFPPQPGALPFPILFALTGNRDFRSEDLLAFELGYRARPTNRISLDLTAFYNIYDNLRSFSLEMTKFRIGPPPFLFMVNRFSNEMKGETYGIEAAVDWRPLTWCHLQAAYTHLQTRLRLKSTNAMEDPTLVGTSPRHQLSFLSSFDLPGHLELDLWLRYVSALHRINLESYVTLDARLAWRPVKNLELSVVGQNLLEKRHEEFSTKGEGFSPALVPRGVYGKITWRY